MSSANRVILLRVTPLVVLAATLLLLAPRANDAPAGAASVFALDEPGPYPCGAEVRAQFDEVLGRLIPNHEFRDEGVRTCFWERYLNPNRATMSILALDYEGGSINEILTITAPGRIDILQDIRGGFSGAGQFHVVCTSLRAAPPPEIFVLDECIHREPVGD